MAKCPCCKQVLPDITGWKIPPRSLVTGDSRLSWTDEDGEHGAAVGESNHLTPALMGKRLTEAIQELAQDQSTEVKNLVEYWAMETAAKELADTLEGSYQGGSWVWDSDRKASTARTMLLRRATEIIVSQLATP